MDVKNLCMGCMEESTAGGACPRCGWLAGQPPESPLYLPPGTTLHDQFIVGRVLGHGGFGITYLAWDMSLERRVAIKEYLPNGIATRTTGAFTVGSYSGQKTSYDVGLQKFLEEARVLARFQSHPGMVAVQFFFPANGTAYLIMEYLEGVTLDAYLKDKGGKISFNRAMDVLMPVMDALREVHKTGILHRDVSPDNIYITRAGPVKLLDFGAARYALGQHSQNFSIILKEGYAPEEQYRSKGHQGPWTDVYACAATLYRAITGRVPVPALDRAHTDELEPPSIAGAEIAAGAEKALMKALAVDAAARYQSMEDFQAAISGLELGRDSVEIPPLTVPLREKTVAPAGIHLTPAAQPSGKLPQKKTALGPLLVLARRVPRTRRTAMLGGVAALALILVVLAAVHHPSQPPVSLSQQTASAGPPTQGTPANSNPSPSSPPQNQPPNLPQNSRSTLQRSGPAAPPPQSNQQPSPQPSRQPNQQPSQQPSQQLRGAPNSSRNYPPAQPAQPQSASPQNGNPAPNGQPPTQPAQSGQPYQATIAQAEAALRQNNAAAALQLAQRAIQEDPTKPTAYDMVGYLQLYYYGDYDAARQNGSMAIQHGGFALFRVRHDTNDGSFSNATSGFLRVSSSGVTYSSAKGGDSFKLSLSSIEQADMNKAVVTNLKRFFGRVERNQQEDTPLVHGAFHIKGPGQNYNLVGTSRSPSAEAGVILGFLNR